MVLMILSVLRVLCGPRRRALPLWLSLLRRTPLFNRGTLLLCRGPILLLILRLRRGTLLLDRRPILLLIRLLGRRTLLLCRSVMQPLTTE